MAGERESETRFIPTSFDELTPEFLSAALLGSGALTAGGVSDRKIEIVGAGVGFAGRVARLRLEYTGAGEPGPASLIAKLPSDNPKNRSAVEALNGYEREVCFFREAAAESRLAIPRCLYADMDPDPGYEKRPVWLSRLERIPVIVLRMSIPLAMALSRRSKRRYLVLLEDLAPARTGDQVAGCDHDLAERVVRGLAAFHASYWNDPKLAERIWLPSLDTLPRAMMALYRSGCRGFFRRYEGQVPSSTRDASEWLDRRFEAVLAHLSGAPVTLIHGDFRLDNLFFEGDRMWVVDFQAPARGRPTQDLAYFVTGSVQPEVDEEALIDAYCDELSARGVRDYDRAECGRDYALSKLVQLYLYIAGERMLDFGEERGVRLIEAMRERLFARLPAPPYDGLL